MTFWRLLQVPINIYVIEKVLTSVQVDVFIICANDYVVALLSFRLSDEVGLMLTFILALLVKLTRCLRVRHLRDQCPFAPHL
jgi:hypothetical protein